MMKASLIQLGRLSASLKKINIKTNNIISNKQICNNNDINRSI